MIEYTPTHYPRPEGNVLIRVGPVFSCWYDGAVCHKHTRSTGFTEVVTSPALIARIKRDLEMNL